MISRVSRLRATLRTNRVQGRRSDRDVRGTASCTGTRRSIRRTLGRRSRSRRVSAAPRHCRPLLARAAEITGRHRVPPGSQVVAIPCHACGCAILSSRHGWGVPGVERSNGRKLLPWRRSATPTISHVCDGRSIGILPSEIATGLRTSMCHPLGEHHQRIVDEHTLSQSKNSGRGVRRKNPNTKPALAIG